MADSDRVKEWSDKFWNVDNIPWHNTEPNAALVKHWYRATGGRKEMRVLFPLCGASVDLAWLYRQGHTVVGVEGTWKAVEKLFSDANLEYDVLNLDSNTSRFMSTDSRLTVFVADMFSVTSKLVGTFDAVFDRGALEALNEEDRNLYLSIMRSCLRDEFTYLLSGFEYDSSLKEGPPRPLPPKTVNSLFQEFGSVSVLADEEDEGARMRFKLPSLKKYTYLIRRKL